MPPDKPSADPSPPPKRVWLRAALILTVVAAIAGFYLAGWHRYFDWATIKGHVGEFQAEVNNNLLLTIAVFALLYVSATALSLPVAAALSLLGGAIFGRWLGTGVVATSATAGATLAFLGSRFLFRNFVERRFGGRLRSIREGVDRDGAFYLFTLRLVPAFPFFLVNLAMGLTRMRVGTFALVSLIGMLPGTFVYVNAGTAISEIDSPAGILSPGVLISFALLGLAPLVIRKLVRRK